jgi:hypothetical protein
MCNKIFFYLRVKKGEADKFVTLHTMNAYRRSGSIVPIIHIFGTRWMSVISLTPRLLHAYRKSPRLLHAYRKSLQHPKNKKMGKPWSLSGSFVKRKILLLLSIFKPQTVRPVLLLLI